MYMRELCIIKSPASVGSGRIKIIWMKSIVIKFDRSDPTRKISGYFRAKVTFGARRRSVNLLINIQNDNTSFQGFQSFAVIFVAPSQQFVQFTISDAVSVISTFISTCINQFQFIQISESLGFDGVYLVVAEIDQMQFWIVLEQIFAQASEFILR